MNSLIQKWIDAKKDTAKALQREHDAFYDAGYANLPLPCELVKAESKDIVQGNIIWYPRWALDEDSNCSWTMVEEVLHPNDEWKAYCAYDGCRYGLDGAFVEKKHE